MTEDGEVEMAEDLTARPGPIDGLARILRELIRTPRFRSSVQIVTSELDPEGARLLVKTLVWEDIAFFLSIASAFPQMINACVYAVAELVRSFGEFPEPLLLDFATQSIGSLDTEAMGAVLSNAVALAGRLSALDDDAFRGAVVKASKGLKDGFAGGEESAAEKLVQSFLPAVSAWMERAGKASLVEGSAENRAVKAFSGGLKQALDENPEFVRGVVAPIANAWREAALTVEGGEDG